MKLLISIGALLLIGRLFLKSSELIYAVTGGIILWYTLETSLMRRAIVDNTEISIRPVLVMELDFHNKTASMRNYGNFPAYNVEICG